MLKKLVALAAFTTFTTGPAMADTLDDVVDRGTLRCGVVLDFPPIGYRDANNEPAGFDVEYCNDLAAALEVEAEILPLTWAERLPVIVTGRADVVFGATSDSLERARTVGFTIPYAIYVRLRLRRNIRRCEGYFRFGDLQLRHQLHGSSGRECANGTNRWPTCWSTDCGPTFPRRSHPRCSRSD